MGHDQEHVIMIDIIDYDHAGLVCSCGWTRKTGPFGLRFDEARELVATHINNNEPHEVGPITSPSD